MTWRMLATVFLMMVGAMLNLAGSDDPAKIDKEAAANLVKRLGETTYQVGQVTFDAKTRIISLPAEVWNTEGVMEYVLVHENGKIHESIFATNTSPTHLQLALKLLKYQADNGELFERLTGASDRSVQVAKTKQLGATFTVNVTWSEAGESKNAVINDFIVDTETNQPVKDYRWYYTGSVLHQGTFLAEQEGSIVGLYLDPAALFNTDAPGAEFDERWTANKAVLPKPGTKVIVQFVPVEIASKEPNKQKDN